MVLLYIAVVITLIIVVAFLIIYITDDYGEYSLLKPSFLDYTRQILAEVLWNIKEMFKKMSFWTRNGRVYHPENRPENYFQKGEKIFFLNIMKGWPFYGEPTDLAIPEQPEGRLSGIVLQQGHGIVRVAINGQEYNIYLDSAALMHHWEYFSLKKNPIIRFFYFLDPYETEMHLKEVLENTPLRK